MTEFLLGLLLSIIAVTATSALLRTEWQRMRCSYLTFEATHARLVGSRAHQNSQVRVTEGPDEVRGAGRCGRAREQVVFPRLESE